MKTIFKSNNFKQTRSRIGYDGAVVGGSAKSFAVLGLFKVPRQPIIVNTLFQENYFCLAQFINFYPSSRGAIVKKYKKYNLNYKKSLVCGFLTNRANFSFRSGVVAYTPAALLDHTKIRILSLKYLFYKKGFMELTKSGLASEDSATMHRRSRLVLPGLMEQVFKYTSATTGYVRASCFKRQVFIFLKKMRLWGRILYNHIRRHQGLTKNSVLRAITALPTRAMRNLPACFDVTSIQLINNTLSSSVTLVKTVENIVTTNINIFYKKALDSIMLRYFAGASLPVNRKFSPFSGIQKQIINL